MRTHRTFTGRSDNCSVVSPPWAWATAPAGNVCQTPAVGLRIGFSPVQYCTAYFLAYGWPQAIRIAVTSACVVKSRNTHCGCSVSLSPVNAWVRYGLLFQYDWGSPSVSREYPTLSVPSSRVTPRCGNG